MNLEDAADLGTALAAVATLVLVGFGVRQLIALQKQVELGQQATDAAVTAAEAAQQAVLETARARIDEQVARVAVISEDPQWPPLRNPLLSSMPAGNEARLFDTMTLHGSPEVGADDLIFPQDADQLMWFVVRGVVTNEGRSTARIRLDGEGRFIEGMSPLIPGEQIEIPPAVGGWRGNPSYLFMEHLLRPGKSALFEWAAGCPVSEWAELHNAPIPAGGCIYLKVFDSAEHGVVDTVKVEVQGRPLQPVQQRNGHWALSSTPHMHMGVTVWPTQREYRNEVPPPES
ncbi:hypothetical protein [Streptomyces californicus]|uniref:hypothetical protein n=1 Tax=Streptomyces californicus TaxID=67351 RepID=UPI0033F65A70